MKPITAAALSALVFGTIGWFVGLSIGFTGLRSALILGGAGSCFGLLILAVGAKALWLPAAGLAVGLALVLAVQMMSTTAIEMYYYVISSLLTAAVITPLVSALLLLSPPIRKAALGKPRPEKKS